MLRVILRRSGLWLTMPDGAEVERNCQLSGSSRRAASFSPSWSLVDVQRCVQLLAGASAARGVWYEARRDSRLPSGGRKNIGTAAARARYETELRARPNSSGHITLRLQLDATGAVSSALVTFRATCKARVSACGPWHGAPTSCRARR